MSNKFLVGVATAEFYDNSSNLLFSSKTMLDTSIDISSDSTTINGGQGNSKLYEFYHTGNLDIALTETQFSLGMISANMGSAIVTGADVWDTETAILGVAGAGSVIGTPIVSPDEASTIYGWIVQKDGTETRVTFTGQDFTLAGGTDGEVVCVRYYKNDSAARSVTINSNIIPSVGRLVLTTQLGVTNSTSGSGLIGKVQIEIPEFTLSGNQSIEMSSSGVSTTPLSGTALASSGTGSCENSSVYGTITEIIDGSNWYDNVVALALVSDDIALTHPDTEQLVVYAVPSGGGAAFQPPLLDLDFTSGTPATCTVNTTGLITSVAIGTSNIEVKISAKPTIETNASVTVS